MLNKKKAEKQKKLKIEITESFEEKRKCCKKMEVKIEKKVTCCFPGLPNNIRYQIQGPCSYSFSPAAQSQWLCHICPFFAATERKN